MAFLWNPWNVLTRMRRRRKKKKEKNYTFYIAGRDDQIATSTRLLSMKYEFYRFGADLNETIN